MPSRRFKRMPSKGGVEVTSGSAARRQLVPGGMRMLGRCKEATACSHLHWGGVWLGVLRFRLSALSHGRGSDGSSEVLPLRDSALECQFSLKGSFGSRQGCALAFAFGPGRYHLEAIAVE